MRNIRPERTVVINVKDLLSKMRTNREEHKQIYEEAMEGYRNKCIELLSERLEEAKVAASNSKEVNLHFNLMRPNNYIEQYDTIIEMLEWTTEATIEVSMAEFNAWVRDRWDWQRNFLENSVNYSATALVKSASL